LGNGWLRKTEKRMWTTDETEKRIWERMASQNGKADVDNG
jgi:hypothetical protein